MSGAESPNYSPDPERAPPGSPTLKAALRRCHIDADRLPDVLGTIADLFGGRNANFAFVRQWYAGLKQQGESFLKEGLQAIFGRRALVEGAFTEAVFGERRGACNSQKPIEI